MLRAQLYMEHLDGPFSLAALPYSQMNELLSRTGDRMYSRPNDPPPPPPLMHPLGEIKPPSVIRWERNMAHTNLGPDYNPARQMERFQNHLEQGEAKLERSVLLLLRKPHPVVVKPQLPTSLLIAFALARPAVSSCASPFSSSGAFKGG